MGVQQFRASKILFTLPKFGTLPPKEILLYAILPIDALRGVNPLPNPYLCTPILCYQQMCVELFNFCKVNCCHYYSPKDFPPKYMAWDKCISKMEILLLKPFNLHQLDTCVRYLCSSIIQIFFNLTIIRRYGKCHV